MSDDLIKKYNLDEDDFWTLRGNKIISFDGVIKIIEAENIKFGSTRWRPFVSLKPASVPKQHHPAADRIPRA